LHLFFSEKYSNGDVVIIDRGLGHHECARVHRRQNDEILCEHQTEKNGKFEHEHIAIKNIKFSLTMQHDCEWKDDIVEFDVRKKEGSENMYWDVKNTGNVDFGVDCQLVLTKGKYGEILKATVPDCKPQQTVQISFLFVWNIQKEEHKSIYEDDLIYHIRLAKGKDNEKRIFGGVGRFRLNVKNLELQKTDTMRLVEQNTCNIM